MPRDPGDPPMIQCKGCGRAVWSNHVNSRGRCSLCSPVRVHQENDEPVEGVIADTDEPAVSVEPPATE